MKNLISRINWLAEKSRTPQGLNAAEKEEQAKLRREYINRITGQVKSQLDRIEFVDDEKKL